MTLESSRPLDAAQWEAFKRQSVGEMPAAPTS